MKITKVKVAKVKDVTGHLLGYADIFVDDAIAIHNIRLVEGNDRRFLAFPSVKKVDKELSTTTYTDLVHPLNSEVRKEIEDIVFEEFDKLAE